MSDGMRHLPIRSGHEQQRKTEVFAKIRYNRHAASAIMEWIVMTAGAAGMTAHA